MKVEDLKLAPEVVETLDHIHRETDINFEPGEDGVCHTWIAAGLAAFAALPWGQQRAAMTRERIRRCEVAVVEWEQMEADVRQWLADCRAWMEGREFNPDIAEVVRERAAEVENRLQQIRVSKAEAEQFALELEQKVGA